MEKKKVEETTVSNSNNSNNNNNNDLLTVEEMEIPEQYGTIDLTSSGEMAIKKVLYDEYLERVKAQKREEELTEQYLRRKISESKSCWTRKDTSAVFACRIPIESKKCILWMSACTNSAKLVSRNTVAHR